MKKAPATTTKGRERAPSSSPAPVRCDAMNPAASRSRSPKPKAPRVPRMTRHASGQARVRLAGRTHYLGAWGSVEAHSRYAELVRAFLANGKRGLAPAPTIPEASLTVAGLFTLFKDWIDATGKYTKGGEPTTSRWHVDDVTKRFGEFAGTVPVARLTEALVLQWRDRLEANPNITRKGINRKVTSLLAILRWGRSRGYVPKPVWADVASIEPLQRGQCGSRPEHGRPRRAPSFEDIERVASAAPRQVAAMLRLQALTGMRPGEVCKLRGADIDKSGPVVDGVQVWIYNVNEGKTAHHGHVTRYALPPAAQAILAEFPAMPSAFVFSPAEAMAERRQQRRAARKSKVQPSQAQRDANARRDYAEVWTSTTYRHAVEDACQRAGVEPFTPHEVRHAFATWAAAALGVIAASVALNHRNLSTTQRYVHPDASLAFAAAAAVQRRVSS